MNSDAIKLSNDAVAQLEAGNVVVALDMLSQSANIIAKAGADHRHVDSPSSTYRFQWSDCTNAAKAPLKRRQRQKQDQKLDSDLVSSMDVEPSPSLSDSQDAPSPTSPTIPSSTTPSTSQQQRQQQYTDRRSQHIIDNGGNSAFLFLKALVVTTPNASSEYIDTLCPCGFAWCVWYNLALCCSLLGTRLGERGLRMLKTGLELYRRVQRRIESEDPSSTQWNILQMAVLNNQACIYQDFSMHEVATACLNGLQSVVQRSTLRGAERKMFLINLQILGGQCLAAAA